MVFQLLLYWLTYLKWLSSRDIEMFGLLSMSIPKTGSWKWLEMVMWTWHSNMNLKKFPISSIMSMICLTYLTSPVIAVNSNVVHVYCIKHRIFCQHHHSNMILIYTIPYLFPFSSLNQENAITDSRKYSSIMCKMLKWDDTDMKWNCFS